MYGLILFSVFLTSTYGTRIFVDDANSSWTYIGAWNVITPATPCAMCTMADPSKAFNHTWHDTSGLSSAQLAFTGVSIEVYTICPDVESGYGTNFTFTLDDIGDGTFRGPQPSCARFVYNYLVYARTNLTLGPHLFEISNTPQGGLDTITNLLLDYAVYDDGSVVAPPVVAPPVVTPPPTSNSHSSLPIVAVIVPAIVAGLLLLANISRFIWYRTHKKKSPPITPYQQQPLLTG